MRYRGADGVWRDTRYEVFDGCDQCGRVDGHADVCGNRPPDPQRGVEIEGDRLSGHGGIAPQTDSLGRRWFEDERPDERERERTFSVEAGDWDAASSGRRIA